MKSFPGYSESLLGFNPGKVEAPLTVDEPEFFPVLFNEIDINQHFNTGRYLERINNSYSFDFLRTHMLREMEVNFLKEGLPDDRLTVRQQRVTPLEHLCSIQREKDLAELIRARLVWEQRV
jgi:acyl-ACP thioesterase